MRTTRAPGAALLAALLATGCSLFTSPGTDPAIGSIRVFPESISVQAAPNVFENGIGELEAKILSPDSQEVSSIEPMWRSNAPAIAAVTSIGFVIGRAPGVASVSASAGGRSSSATVTVTPSADSIIIIAHRGFQALFPENTLPAIWGAFDNGADGVEIDLRWTQDNVAVLMHDATVDRTTNGTGTVAKLTYAQIQQLDACSKFGGGVGPCSVPTLGEALEAARGRGFLVLDINGPFPPGGFETMLTQIRDAQMQHAVVVIAFSDGALQSIRRLDASIGLGLNTSQFPDLANVRPLGRAASLPDMRLLLNDPVRARVFIKAASQAGIDVAPWTITDLANARALVALGVRVLTSDVPLVKRELQQ